MKVAFAAAIFDMLHAGHIELLTIMRREADRVIVILHDDKSCYQIKNKIPIQDLGHRIKNVKITGLVDEVMITRSTDPSKEFDKVWRKYRKHDLVYMRGDDKTDMFPGHWYLLMREIPVKFKKYTKGVSSSKIRDSL